MALGTESLFLVLLSFPFLVNGDVECYHCSDVADPSLCQNVTHCPTGSQCLIEKIVATDGGITYKMGCATNKLCHSITGNPVLIGKRQTSHPGCHACCNSARCNDRCCNGEVTLEACCKQAGYMYVQETGICIKLYHQLQSWPVAEELCMGDNAHLLIVRNISDFNFVKKHIDPELSGIQPVGACHSQNQVWVGGNDMDTEGQFQWWNGEHFSAWQNHMMHVDDGSCDNNQHGADCVLINFTQKRLWYDRHCDYELPFVCQMF